MGWDEKLRINRERHPEWAKRCDAADSKMYREMFDGLRSVVADERAKNANEALNFRASNALKIISDTPFTIHVRAPWYKRVIGIKLDLKRFRVN